MKETKSSRRRVKKTGVAVMAAALVIASPYTVVFAENKSAVNEKSSQAEYVEMKEEGNLEYIEWEEPDEKIFDGDIFRYARSDYSTFNWTVKPDTLIQSAGKYKNVGDSISVAVDVTPGDATIRVGIKTVDGMKRYVRGESTIRHTFNITQAGTYKVFVENTSEVTVTVNGSYK